MLKNKLEKILNANIKSIVNISTGVNLAYKVSLNNHVVFVKLGKKLDLEAKELILLGKNVKTPKIIFASDTILILEYLQQETNNNTQTQLANQLINLHSKTSNNNFDFNIDNKIGITKQINTINKNWADFYFKNRVLFQIELAKKQNLINNNDYKLLIRLEKITYQLLDIIVKPVLLHGDLWSGNFISTKNNVYFIDSSCYYGHSEVDLSLGFIFGGFDNIFYQHYFAHILKQDGFENRKYLYMLYHYLNHLNIFGSSYYRDVMHCIKQLNNYKIKE